MILKQNHRIIHSPSKVNKSVEIICGGSKEIGFFEYSSQYSDIHSINLWLEKQLSCAAGVKLGTVVAAEAAMKPAIPWHRRTKALIIMVDYDFAERSVAILKERVGFNKKHMIKSSHDSDYSFNPTQKFIFLPLEHSLKSMRDCAKNWYIMQDRQVVHCASLQACFSFGISPNHKDGFSVYNELLKV